MWFILTNNPVLDSGCESLFKKFKWFLFCFRRSYQWLEPCSARRQLRAPGRGRRPPTPRTRPTSRPASFRLASARRRLSTASTPPASPATLPNPDTSTWKEKDSSRDGWPKPTKRWSEEIDRRDTSPGAASGGRTSWSGGQTRPIGRTISSSDGGTVPPSRKTKLVMWWR